MSWLTTADSANRIEVSKRVDVETASITFSNQVIPWNRDTTTTVHKFVGMTYAAANSELVAINDPTNGVFAVLSRGGNGGNYTLTVTTITQATWAVVT
tara:strand:+ start:226 stop:519 length:294 start_codon:yes stop_codon:yes gene_type:complete